MANQVRNALLLSCGSFNPPTIMHLRLFELARDHLTTCGYDVLGGMISPVHDKYKEKKPSLIPAKHRIKMVELSVRDYPFVKCSKWEIHQEGWTRTRQVLEEHLSQINNAVKYPQDLCEKYPHLPNSLKTLSSAQVSEPHTFRLFFICGGDLLESFSVPNLWKDEDIESIVKNFGLIVITREGSNPQQYIEKHHILRTYEANIHIVKEPILNDISSTKIRDAVKRETSIRFFVPDSVINYISDNKLYL